MSYSLVNWQYLTPTTADRFNQMQENAVRTSEHSIVGCELNILGTGTASANPGRIEIDGKWLTRNDAITSIALSATADWADNTAIEAASTAIYVVAYNDSASSFNVKYINTPPAYSDTTSGTSTGPKRYDKVTGTWYRYLGAVMNDAASNIMTATQKNNIVWYDRALTGGFENTSTAAEVNLGDTHPSLICNQLFHILDVKQANAHPRINFFGDMPVTANHAFLIGEDLGAQKVLLGWLPVLTGSSYDSSIYMATDGNRTGTFLINGYEMNLR